jgi:hypothetical protein
VVRDFPEEILEKNNLGIHSRRRIVGVEWSSFGFLIGLRRDDLSWPESTSDCESLSRRGQWSLVSVRRRKCGLGSFMLNSNGSTTYISNVALYYPSRRHTETYEK